MKKIILAFLFLLPLCACAQDASDTSKTEETVTGETVQSDPAERNKMLYALGFLIGDNLKEQLILDNEDDYKAVSQGMRDSLLGKQPQTDIEAQKDPIRQKYEEDAKKIHAKRQAEQEEFLKNFQKEKGVKKLENGALIKLSRAGSGKNPKANSTVTVHYTGTLLDGTKFDSSRDRNTPFTTRLTDVIPCWTKGMQQMKPGAVAKLVCPPQTAYGSRPVGPIPPDSVLIFEVEMISVDK